MRSISFIFCLFICQALQLYSQTDTIISTFNQTNGLTVDHMIKQGQTIFGLSHEYGSNVKKTLDLNADKNLSLISTGTIIRFSLNPSILSDSITGTIFTPVYYQVKPKETLYTISRLYLGRDVKDIMILNKKSSYNLDINERLLIGYIKSPSQDSKTDEIINKKDIATEVANHGMYKILSPPTEEISLGSFQLESFVKKLEIVHKERGLAIWENTEYGSHELLVMHPFARVNSKIRLYNPMMNKVVEAKVVGTMPKNSYPQNISVVISPGVAHALGALDKRFLVEMTYTE